MKICKVVFNAVMHDARVLKQASSLRAAGHDVTIIGIQTNDDNTLFRKLDNGVVVRLVDWKLNAYKPLEYLSLVKLIVVVVMTLFCSLFGYFCIKNFLEIDWLSTKFVDEYFRFEYLWVYITAFIISIVFIKYYKGYLYQKRLIGKLAESKDENSLRYSSLLAEHLGSFDSEGGMIHQKQGVIKKFRNNIGRCFYELIPRPLMQGFPTIHSIGMWRMVFARESAVHRTLLEEKPDVVHAHDLSALPVAAQYISCLKGVRLVFDAHEMYDNLAQSTRDEGKLNCKILRKYASKVDLFITINDSIGSYYLSHYKYLPKAVIVKNATLPSKDVMYDNRLHREIGVDSSKKILLYQGGFAPNRGLIRLLMSAKYLNEDWCLVFMGFGKLEGELRRIAKMINGSRQKNMSKVFFAPRVPQSDLVYWTAGATLGVIPYENSSLNHWYCTPNKLWEYPNAGVPIVASPFPELRSVIESNNIGWLFGDPLDPVAFANLVNKISDDDLRNTSKMCKEFITRDNWNLYEQRLLKAYEELR